MGGAGYLDISKEVSSSRVVFAIPVSMEENPAFS